MENSTMIDQSSEASLRGRLQASLEKNRDAVKHVEDLMKRELEKRFSDRKHYLLAFLADERRLYTGIIEQLEQVLDQQRQYDQVSDSL